MSIRSSRAIAGATLLLTAGAAQASVLSDWSLVVLNNLDSTSEVEGRTAVGGNLSGPASNYGIHLTPASNYLTTDVLVVGGNITAGNVNMTAGRVRHGGSIAMGTNINHNGGGSTINDPGALTFVQGLHSQAQGISAFLGGLASTNTVAIPAPVDQPTGVTFNAVPGGNGVAVFNITASQLFGNSKVQSIGLNINGATSIVINVAGNSTSWNAGNFVGNFNSAFARSNVIWNFTNASSIIWNGGNTLNGALLAPGADMQFNGTMEGSVVVKSLVQRGEVHLPTYQGYVPTPGTAMLLGVAGIVSSRRRRG